MAALLVAFIVVSTVVVTIGITEFRRENSKTAPAVLYSVIGQGQLTYTVSGVVSVMPASNVSVHTVDEGVVTRNGPRAGATISEGGVVGYVNERPIVLFTGSVPVYRSLKPGDQGADVRQLQEGLSRLGYRVWDDLGVFGKSTSLAVFRYYKKIGSSPVDDLGNPVADNGWAATGVPSSELVFSPSAAVIAKDSCGDAGESAAGVLCELESTAGVIVIGVSRTRIGSETGIADIKGKQAQIQATQRIEGTVGASYDMKAENGVSSQDTGSSGNDGDNADIRDGNSASKDGADDAAEPSSSPGETSMVYYRFDAKPNAKLPENLSELNDAQVVMTIESSAPDSLLVDSVALETDGKDQYLSIEGGSRIRVSLGMCYQGRCVVSGKGLKAGNKAVIPNGNIGL
jgi:peptidoglycan hydrolase-like protein with peptidoglycan-binding domain